MPKKIKQLIKNIGDKFKENNLSLVTAESCTGGGIAAYISKYPESSSILERGFITYSYPSKESLLQVSPETLQLKGAVSKEVVLEMAKGALKNSEAQVSIAVTGMAGTDKNKIGIVWICCVDIYGNKIVKNKNIKGDRITFIKLVIYETFSILLFYINNFKRFKNKS